MELDEIVKNGGATLDTTLKPVKLERGYCVSLEGHEVLLNLNDPKIKELARETMKMQAVKARKLGAYVGAWVDGGKLYLDISKIVLGRQKAMKLGRLNHQLAIYDNEKAESVYLR